MKIQINSDNQIAADEKLRATVEKLIESTLARAEGRLTRIEVHLSDVNSEKAGGADKRCLLEARPAGKKPVSVTHQAATVEDAVRGAAKKMQRLLRSSFGKTEAKQARATVRGVEAATPAVEPVKEPNSRTAKAPSKVATKKVAKKAAKKKTAPATKETSPRGAKKKGIYQARRKSWPTR